MSSEASPPAGSPSSPYEVRILEAVRRVIRAIELYSKRLVAAHGVTVPQLVCLVTIHQSGPLTLSDLSSRVHISPSTAVGIIDRLERRGLVTRRRDDVDRRRVYLDATKEGGALVAQAPSPLQDRLSIGLRTLSELEQVTIALALEQLVALMEASDLDAAAILDTGPIPRPTPAE